MWINNFSRRLFGVALLIALSAAPLQAAPLAAEDRELLTQVQKDTLQYFIRMSDKETGLTRDSSQAGSPASIAATGFALAAVASGQARGFIPRDYAEKQLHKTLKTLLGRAAHKKGFFYHFLDRRTGKRVWGSEASSIDTALLVAGALLAGRYFPGTEIEKMATQIYTRVDWEWMLNGSLLICMGWIPESGFLPYYWDSYNELMLLQALAIGAPAHAVPAAAWQEWVRPEDAYNGRIFVYSHSGSLFTYQYAQAFIDFRNLNDRGINYFENSRSAALANRDYSLEFRHQHRGYTEDSWGLSASLGPGGYKAYGGKPGQGLQDGTLAPYASISALVFTPEESLRAIRHFYENHKIRLYGQFGFKAGFNLDKRWWADQYVGIDQGISYLMLENFLNEGGIWKRFMELEAVKSWIKLCGLSPQTAAAAA